MPKQPTTKRLKPLVMKYIAARRDLSEMEVRLRNIRDMLIEVMIDRGITVADFELDDGTVVKNTLVQSSTMKVDIEALRELVKPSVFESVTVRSVNMPAFHRAVQSGDISPDILPFVVTEEPRSPYIRTTET